MGKYGWANVGMVRFHGYVQSLITKPLPAPSQDQNQSAARRHTYGGQGTKHMQMDLSCLNIFI